MRVLRASTVSDMLRTRVPIDISLLLGGLLVGIMLGVAVGRHCATHPGPWRRAYCTS